MTKQKPLSGSIITYSAHTLYNVLLIHTCFLRLANLLKHERKERIWAAVREINTQMCGDFKKLPLVMAVEEKLQVKSTDMRFNNITDADLNTAAQMIIYMCTTCTENSNPEWVRFYFNLFKTQSPNEIILTLNRLQVILSSVNNYITRFGVFETNLKLFNRTKAILGLKHKQIRGLIPRKPYNFDVQHNTSINNLRAKGKLGNKRFVRTKICISRFRRD